MGRIEIVYVFFPLRFLWRATELTNLVGWYTDSPSSHWLIDYLSPNLFVASAGSGHAFKFLPLMGSLVAGSLYGRLPPDQAKAWSFAELTLNRKGDSSRGGSGMGERKVLRVEDMITTAEL